MPLTAAQITASLNPVADAFVTTGPSDGPLVDWNYGQTGALQVSGALATRTGVTPAQRGTFETYLRFDLTQIKQGFDTTYGVGAWKVQALSLRLMQGNANNATYNNPATGSFSIAWLPNDTWLEGTGETTIPTTDGITYNSRPTGPEELIGATFSFTNPGTGNATTYLLTLTPQLTADILTSGSNLLSLHLFATNATTSAMSYPINSNNNNVATNRPLLSITVPEPSGIRIGLAGLMVAVAGMTLPKRRRRLCAAARN